jgi:tetratricopeptide (TPR) repeat protein
MGYKLKALEQYRKAVEVNPDFPDVYNALCWTHQDRNELVESYQACSRAIKLRRNYLFAFNNRGNTLVKMGRYDLAVADFDRAIKLNPDYYPPYINKAQALARLKKYDEALKVVSKAIELNRRDPAAYKTRMMVYQELGQKDKVREDFRRLIALDPAQKVLGVFMCVDQADSPGNAYGDNFSSGDSYAPFYK